MNKPKFLKVKHLKRMIKDLDDDLSIGVETVDGYFSPLIPGAEIKLDQHIEGYGIDFLILTADFESQLRGNGE